MQVVDEREVDAVFAELERRLDALARAGDGLTLTVPFACIAATRTETGG